MFVMEAAAGMMLVWGRLSLLFLDLLQSVVKLKVSKCATVGYHTMFGKRMVLSVPRQIHGVLPSRLQALVDILMHSMNMIVIDFVNAHSGFPFSAELLMLMMTFHIIPSAVTVHGRVIA